MRVRTGLLLLLLTQATSGDLDAQNAASSRPVRRTASIAGRILHPDGAAADSAKVAVYAVREGAAAAIVGTATSSYDGRYEVTGLPAGTFIVGVTPQKAGGFGGETKRPTAMPVETLYPGVTDRDRAQPISVFEGIPTEGIDVWLAPAPQRFSIGGRVFWPDGIEVDNLTIEYGGRDAIRRGIWSVDDPGGVFTIEGVAEGTYVLLARGETASGPLIGIASTDVALGSVEDVRLALRRPGAIAGRIVVEGAGTTPFADLHVSPVQMLLKLSPLYPVEAASVSEDGRFEIPHLGGEYTIDVEGLPRGWRIRRTLRNGALVPDNRIIVPLGERVTSVDIVIGNGAT